MNQQVRRVAGCACATKEKIHSTVGPAYMPATDRFSSSPNSPNMAQKGRKKAPAVCAGGGA